jgi:monoamine oxidase
LSSASLSDGDVTWTWEGGGAAADGSPSVLTAFSGGPAAERCLAGEAADRDAAYRARLEPAYPGYGGTFERGRFMGWPSDAWTRGGYSFPAPGEVTTMGPMLSRGLGSLSFAGEHACYKFVGYMEGALQSGVSTARRLSTMTTSSAPAAVP